MSELSGGSTSADHQPPRRRRRRELLLATLIVAAIAASGVFALAGDDGSADETSVRQALERTFTDESGAPLPARDIEVEGDAASAVVHVRGNPRTVRLVKKGDRWLVLGVPPGE